MGDFPHYFDIILFAMVAAFLVLRLRSVLGRRTGNERRRDPCFAARAGSRQPTADKVVALGNRVPAPPPPRDAPPADAVAAGLDRIRSADPSFDPAAFLEGARVAFEMIVGGFRRRRQGAAAAAAERRSLQAVRAAIDERDAAGETLETRVLQLKATDIVEAGLAGRTARVTVKFVSDQINVLRAHDGSIVDGDPEQPDREDRFLDLCARYPLHRPELGAGGDRQRLIDSHGARAVTRRAWRIAGSRSARAAVDRRRCAVLSAAPAAAAAADPGAGALRPARRLARRYGRAGDPGLLRSCAAFLAKPDNAPLDARAKERRFRHGRRMARGRAARRRRCRPATTTRRGDFSKPGSRRCSPAITATPRGCSPAISRSRSTARGKRGGAYQTPLYRRPPEPGRYHPRRDRGRRARRPGAGAAVGRRPDRRVLSRNPGLGAGAGCARAASRGSAMTAATASLMSRSAGC